MDPVTHTLVGASLAEAGLKRRSALGTATLLIGANLPDVDVVSYFWGPETALWLRRGVTHGLPALIVLPLVLTGIMVAWGWLRRRSGGGQRARAVQPRQLLLLAGIAVATHPLLDFLNVYGMRWLMPFSDTWSYGDTLFIVDPWVWAGLVGGIYLARRRSTAGPARAALALVVLYVAGMAASNVVARRVVAAEATALGFAPERLMVAPTAVNPFRRWVVLDDGERYRFGRLAWLPRPAVEFLDLTYENSPMHPAAAAATRGPRPRKFLSWARFPYYVVEMQPGQYVVRIGDARYTIDPERSWAATAVIVDRRSGGP